MPPVLLFLAIKTG